MAIVPVPRGKKIQFFKVRLAPWAEHASEIGLGGDDAGVMAELVAEAQAAWDAQRRARDAARTATQRYRQAVQQMAGHGADCIRKIKARAAAAGGTWNDVYAAAQIPPAADPSPLPPPGTPDGFRVALRQDGTIQLAWTCKNPKGSQGTLYEVWRQVGWDGGDAGFQFLATVGTKKFVDATVPAGTAPLVYKIVAVRSTKRGMPGTFVVKFGVNAGGGGAAAVALQRAA